jgi:hypothetical protein
VLYIATTFNNKETSWTCNSQTKQHLSLAQALALAAALPRLWPQKASSWPSQQYEAALPNNEKKPVLEILARNKGITLEEMVEKVKTKISEYNLSIANLLTEEQKLKSQVKNCKSIADCHRLRHFKFGISMTGKQMQDESVLSSPATIKITF